MSATSAEGVSTRFHELLEAEPLGELAALDVGTGRGRIALWLASRCPRVVGIDRDVESIAEARRLAARSGLTNVQFVVADAEDGEYDAWAPDLVTAHLCMSDAIAERASRALAPGHVLAFVAFHADQWRETGRRSRFAYDEGKVESLLARLGFDVEHLGVERSVETFPSVEAALAAVVGLEERWKLDGRWFHYIKFLEEGGRTLTRAHVVAKARRR